MCFAVLDEELDAFFAVAAATLAGVGAPGVVSSPGKKGARPSAAGVGGVAALSPPVRACCARRPLVVGGEHRERVVRLAARPRLHLRVRRRRRTAGREARLGRSAVSVARLADAGSRERADAIEALRDGARPVTGRCARVEGAPPSARDAPSCLFSASSHGASASSAKAAFLGAAPAAATAALGGAAAPSGHHSPLLRTLASAAVERLRPEAGEAWKGEAPREAGGGRADGVVSKERTASERTRRGWRPPRARSLGRLWERLVRERVAGSSAYMSASEAARSLLDLATFAHPPRSTTCCA